MSLTKPALTELSTEHDLTELVNEWLALWFDGRRHAVGANDPVEFPDVYRKFNQSKITQPLSDKDSDKAAVEIRLVVLPRVEERYLNDSVLATGKLATQYVLFNFWIKAKEPGEGRSEALAQRVAGLLKAILDNPDSRYPLCERGIAHLHPNAPQVLPSATWSERLVTCSAQLNFAIRFGSPVHPVPDPRDQSVLFYNEAPVITGEYLTEDYSWPTRTQIVSAILTGWPATDTDVVLGLDDNGVLTGARAIFPAGAANQDQVATVRFEGLFVNPNRTLRWKVLSAPPPETSAWHLSLALQVRPYQDTVAAGNQQNVDFYNESPVQAGAYLLGQYQWPARTQLQSGVITFWPAEFADVQLGLEVNGQLTEVTLTLPAGPPNADQTLPFPLTDRWVNPSHTLRWKVLSAPEPEDSAWHVTLTLHVQPR